MLRTRSLRILLGIGFMLLMVGCIPVSDGSTSEVSGLPRPTLTPPTLPVQNKATIEATVKFIIDKPLVDETGGVQGLAFSPDDKTLASLYKSGEIILWDIDTRQSLRSFSGGGEVNGLGIMPGFAFSPDGKWLVSKANGAAPVLWDIATGQSTEVESGLSHGDGMALSPDGKLLAYGKCAELNSQSHCGQYEIVLWDVASRQPAGQSLLFSVGAPAPLGLSFSLDGKILAVMSSGTTGSGRIELFDVLTRQSIALPLGGDVQFSGMAFSPDGKFMALAGIPGMIYIWDLESHKTFSTLIGERSMVTGVIFSPNGKRLASRILVPSTESIPHEKIVLWDMNSLQTIGRPLTGQDATGSEAGLISMAFSPDGMTLASGTDEGVIILWNLEEGH